MRRSGRHDAHLLRQPQQDHYPTTTPPQHSGGASSTSYRKRRTNTRPPRGSPSDPAHDHQVTRPAATQATLGAATRVRSEPLKTSTHHNAGEVFPRSLLPNPSTDRGRLVRGGAWHFVRYRGYDISVKDGSARRSRQLPGVPLTCTSPTYPKGYARRGTKAVMPPSPHH